MQTHSHTLTSNDEIQKINFHFNDSLRRLILGKRNMGIEFHRMQHKYSWRGKLQGPPCISKRLHHVYTVCGLYIKEDFSSKPTDNRCSCWFSCFLVTFIADVAWFRAAFLTAARSSSHCFLSLHWQSSHCVLFLSKCFHSVSLPSQSRHIRRWKDLQEFLLRPWRQLKSKYCERKKRNSWFMVSPIKKFISHLHRYESYKRESSNWPKWILVLIAHSGTH